MNKKRRTKTITSIILSLYLLIMIVLIIKGMLTPTSIYPTDSMGTTVLSWLETFAQAKGFALYMGGFIILIALIICLILFIKSSKDTKLEKKDKIINIIGLVYVLIIIILIIYTLISCNLSYSKMFSNNFMLEETGISSWIGFFGRELAYLMLDFGFSFIVAFILTIFSYEDKKTKK